MAYEGQEGYEQSLIVTQAQNEARKFTCSKIKGKINSKKESRAES